MGNHRISISHTWVIRKALITGILEQLNTELLRLENGQHSLWMHGTVESVGGRQPWLLIPALFLTNCATWVNDLTSLSPHVLICKMTSYTTSNCHKDWLRWHVRGLSMLSEHSTCSLTVSCGCSCFYPAEPHLPLIEHHKIHLGQSCHLWASLLTSS